MCGCECDSKCFFLALGKLTICNDLSSSEYPSHTEFCVEMPMPAKEIINDDGSRSEEGNASE